MKKYIKFILLVIILCMLCGCNNAASSKLERQYPDSKILKQRNGYVVISENVDPSGLEIQHSGSTNKITYDTFEQLKGVLYTDRAIAFVGKKTDRSRQYIPVNEHGYVDDLYFTESIVEVITPYFGDIEAGQEIIMHEYYAVFSDEDGSKKICSFDNFTLSKDEQLYVMFTSSKSELFEKGQNRYHCLVYPISLDPTAERRKPGIEVYEKYYINNDTAIDKAEFARGIIKWEARKIEDTDSFTKAEIEQAKRGKAVLESRATTYEQLAEGLSAEHKALIDRLALKYGEK